MMIHLQLASLLLGAACVVCAAATPARAAVTDITLDLEKLGTPFRGWGTSLAWWAHGIGQIEDEATVDEIVRLVTDPKDGLGLNMFRYNIGGGDAPDHHHMRRWGDVPGFKPREDAPYDWSADAAQERVLLKLVKATHGTPIIEAFSNSPPWWMTVSGCVAGADDGGANLKPEYEAAFADYLADVVKHFQDTHGLVFDTLEPFNEPDVNWWKAGKNQEGLHIPREQQARVIRLSRGALDARGLGRTLISANDANSLDDALKALESFDEQTLAALGQVNTHTYFGSKRVELREAAAKRGKPLWQSESGPLNVGGDEYHQIMVMARRIVLDINGMRPELWATWQVVSGGPWGCISENSTPGNIKLLKKFHMLAAFTRAIRPGDRVVELDSDRVLASVSAERGELTLVLVNAEKQPQTFALRLQGAMSLATQASVVRTSRTEDLAAVEDASIRDNTLTLETPAESITRVTLRTGR